ncbi:hypothetical protein Aduo_015788 [Ancylostoma duodenale]
MGPLPPERVTQSPPFTFTGVDMMGPLLINNTSKDDEKRYVALFTPLTVIGNQDDINEVLRQVDFIYKNIRHVTEVIPHEEQCQDDPTYQPSPEISTQVDAKKAILEAEKLIARFWEKWKTEYLIELRERHVLYGNNYKSAKQPPQVGDVVLIDDDLRTSKDHWPMGLIQDQVKSKDGEIRSAILKTSTGRCTRRPSNRLIPLEIHSTSSPEAEPNVERNEEPQQDIVANNDQHRRPVLERKAKKPVSYCENTTSVSTTSTKRGTQTMMLTLIACSLLSSTTAAVLKCTESGVQVDSRSISNTTFQSELCINHRDCSAMQSTPRIHQQDLRPHQLINPYVILWRAVANMSQLIEEITCPEQSICNAIHCTFCPLVLGNPQCYPKTTIAVTATLAYIVIAATVVLLKLCRCMRKISRKSKGDIHSAAQPQIEMMDLSETTRPSHLEVLSIPPNRSRLLFILSILAVTTLSANSCQYTHVINTEDIICNGIGMSAKCRNTADHTFTMSSFKKEICMRIEHKRDFIGTLHLKLDSIRFKCSAVTHFFTRNFPGITRCQESCGGIGCGCLLPMPGCLFSRTYAEPADESIYEVFSCASWRKVAVLNTRLNMVSGEEIKRNVEIHPQETVQFGKMNITLDFITTPFIPELDRKFVQIMNKIAPDTIIAHQDDIFAVKCLTLQTARNLTKCRVIDTCSCTAKSVENDCHCASVNITEKINSIDTRLPLRNSEFRMVAD